MPVIITIVVIATGTAIVAGTAVVAAKKKRGKKQSKNHQIFGRFKSRFSKKTKVDDENEYNENIETYDF